MLELYLDNIKKKITKPLESLKFFRILRQVKETIPPHYRKKKLY